MLLLKQSKLLGDGRPGFGVICSAFAACQRCQHMSISIYVIYCCFFGILNLSNIPPNFSPQDSLNYPTYSLGRQTVWSQVMFSYMHAVSHPIPGIINSRCLSLLWQISRMITFWLVLFVIWVSNSMFWAINLISVEMWHCLQIVENWVNESRQLLFSQTICEGKAPPNCLMIQFGHCRTL